ncbi:chorismate mutase [Bifidobacterium aemilianum]|uniref:Chorismate mutase n=1 Tax=Bifidobacterium aemilianum TaxID=2493120 RepID=A0A366KAJ4_9BIFI|nr:chorismate mutase [Bifidobacterium aemilianum]RBP97691.1 chorismate mutase [Bifidobacterium aemilianum]
MTKDDWQDTTIDERQAAAHPEIAGLVEEVGQLRASVDNIDGAILALLAERFKCTRQIGVLKAQAGFAPEDPQREQVQAVRFRAIALAAGLDPQLAEDYRRFAAEAAKRRHQDIAESIR